MDRGEIVRWLGVMLDSTDDTHQQQVLRRACELLDVCVGCGYCFNMLKLRAEQQQSGAQHNEQAQS